MKIICISGKAQHGKDTTAAYLKEILEGDRHSVLIAHYAGLVKYICKSFFDWNGQKDTYGRTLLQYVGTDVVRQQDPDFWVRFISDVLEFFKDEWDYVLIPDCRFPNEIDHLKERGHQVTHLRVVRNNFDNGLSPEQQAHPSETALDNVKADYYIENPGTAGELYELLCKWVTDFTGHHQMTFKEARLE